MSKLVRYCVRKEGRIKNVRYKHALELDLRIPDLDGRTKEGKMAKVIKSNLRLWVGVGTIASELLIEQTTFKALKIAMYQISAFKAPLEKIHPLYLPMTKSLRQDLIELAKIAKKSKHLIPSIEQIIDEHNSSD